MSIVPTRQEEMLDGLVEFYKALSDRTRLRIVGLLAERERYVQELAEAVDVTPATISHHLFRLRAAGLVAAGRRGNMVYYRLERDPFDRLSRSIFPREETRPPKDEREQVLRAAFDGDRLRRLPSAERKKLMVLEEVVRRFEPRRRYTEREVDTVLKRIYDDHCALRRALVDYRFMERDQGIYQRTSGVSE